MHVQLLCAVGSGWETSDRPHQTNTAAEPFALEKRNLFLYMLSHTDIWIGHYNVMYNQYDS